MDVSRYSDEDLADELRIAPDELDDECWSIDYAVARGRTDSPVAHAHDHVNCLDIGQASAEAARAVG